MKPTIHPVRHLGALGLVLALALGGAASVAAAQRWIPVGPEGGTVAALVFDPADRRTIYAALEEGGVWRSEDSAESWVPASADLPPGTIRALVADPAAPRTLYLGRSADGVWKSVDGGRSWAPVAGELDGAAAEVQVLGFDASTGAVWAGLVPKAGQAALYRSPDGGAHWSPVDLGTSGLPVTALAFGGGDAYAGTQGGGAFRGTSQGTSWTPLSAGVNVSSLAWGGGRLYAATERGLLASLDRGESWQVRIVPPPLVPSLPPNLLTLARIALSPDDPDLLAVGYRFQPGLQPSTQGIYRSADGGVHYESVSGFPNILPRALAFVPGGGGGLVAGPGPLGVWVSADGRASWRSANRGLRAAPVGRVLADPKRPGILYAGGTGEGLLRTLDGGASWAAVGGGVVDEALALDPDRPATLYGRDGERSDALFKSRNGGRLWTQIFSFSGGFALDPLHPQTLFAGRFSGFGHSVHRSDDGGATWREGRLSCTAPLYLAVAPDGRVYAAGSSSCGVSGSERGGVERSDDGGLTFANKRLGLPGIPIPSSLAVDPRRPATLFGGFQGLVQPAPGSGFVQVQGLYRSRDRAELWEVVPSMADLGVPVLDLAFPPAGANAVWAATGGRGIWRSGDAGETFRETAVPGLPTRLVSDLEFDRASPASLYAATPGGLFRLGEE